MWTGPTTPAIGERSLTGCGRMPPLMSAAFLPTPAVSQRGVDVPTLDAVLFLHPRNSQIDVVQSVGRVMRRAPGKRLGYVILPVGVPAGVEPEQALSDNKRYRGHLADSERAPRSRRAPGSGDQPGRPGTRCERPDSDC